VIVTCKIAFWVLMPVVMIGITSDTFSEPAQQLNVVGMVLQQPGSSPSERINSEDEARRKMERDLAKKANKERHAALKRDTDKILKLSSELKTYVDKSNENMLSLEVIKKAEEIEKLAHSVREKMKGN
jgi:hypothetical protein